MYVIAHFYRWGHSVLWLSVLASLLAVKGAGFTAVDHVPLGLESTNVWLQATTVTALVAATCVSLFACARIIQGLAHLVLGMFSWSSWRDLGVWRHRHELIFSLELGERFLLVPFETARALRDSLSSLPALTSNVTLRCGFSIEVLINRHLSFVEILRRPITLFFGSLVHHVLWVHALSHASLVRVDSVVVADVVVDLVVNGLLHHAFWFLEATHHLRLSCNLNGANVPWWP